MDGDSRRNNPNKAAVPSSPLVVGVKKERWLLTRKTWRYMTDAVGNFLPSEPNKTCGSDSSGSVVHEPLPSNVHQSPHLPHFPALIPPTTPLTHPTSSVEGSPGLVQSESGCQVLVAETWFSSTCNNQDDFLIWTRTRPPNIQLLSLNKEVSTDAAPALANEREIPIERSNIVSKYEPRSSGSGSCCGHEDEDESESFDRDTEYDEYDDDQVTAVRKSSLASSISSVISGLSFLRSHVRTLSPPPPVSQPVSRVSVGVQTDPFPEETLNKLRQIQRKDEAMAGNSGAVAAAELDEFDNNNSRKNSVGRKGTAAGADVDGDGASSKLIHSITAGTNNFGDGGGGRTKASSKSSSSGYSSSAAMASSVTSVTSTQARPSTCDDVLPSPVKKEEESAYSASISDTVMRYLRMVRKNSKVDKNDMDRFKTVNYDPSLRNIKSKNVTLEEALEHEKKREEQQQQGQQLPSTPSTTTPSSILLQGFDTKTLVKSEPEKMSKVGGGGGDWAPKKLSERGEEHGRVGDGISGSGSRRSEKGGRVLPSVGIQAGESLVRFLKLFHRRKIAEDLSSPPSYCSSQSPLDLCSPRCSVATTGGVSSSGSDNLEFGSSSKRESGGGGGRGGSSARASFDTNFDPSLEELDEVFTYPPYPHPHPPHASFSPHPTNNFPGQSSYSSHHNSSGARHREGGSMGEVGRSEDWKGRSSRGRDYHHSVLELSGAGAECSGNHGGVSSRSWPRGAGGASSSAASPGESQGGGPAFSAAFHSSSGSSQGLVGQSSWGEQEGGGTGAAWSSLGGPLQYRESDEVDRRSRNRFSLGFRSSSSSRRVKEEQGGRSGSDMSASALNKRNLHSSNNSSPVMSPSKVTNPSSSNLSVMQKSKSSSSVLHQPASSSTAPSTPNPNYSSHTAKLISKSKLWRSRKPGGGGSGGVSGGGGPGSGNGRVKSTWSPQGQSGVWTSLLSGRQVMLESTNVRNLSAVECAALQKVALAKLQGMNLGVDIKIPQPDKCQGESGSGHKPKRRPYLLKKKALSTGFFDSKREDMSKELASGLVFNIPLQQCLRNDHERRKTAQASGSSISPSGQGHHGWTAEELTRRPHHASRLSISSDQTPRDSKHISSTGSAESLCWTESTRTLGLDSMSDLPPTQTTCEDGDWGQVPDLVVACVKHLETYGLHTTGIFRVSSSLKRTRQLREEMDSGKEIHLGEEQSPHDVAALLKEFLRDLPQPLLSKELYEPFLQTLKIRNRRAQLEAMQYLIDLLPLPNRDTLHVLLKLFGKVVDNCQDTRTKTGELISGNKMEAYSLATLIAPNILPCMPLDNNMGSPEQNAILTRERRDSIDVVNYMITNYKDLFLLSPETLNQVYVELLDTNPEAVESILRTKFPAACQQCDDAVDGSENVFEPCPDMAAEDTPRTPLRKREEILHEGGGKGGRVPPGYLNIHSTDPRLEGGKSRSSGLETDSKEKIDYGADSDSSSTKSTSRWFRKSRSGEQKSRASSDSGSDKVKGGGRKKKDGMEECKRASSLDSVNLLRELGKSSKFHDSKSSNPVSGSADIRSQSKDRQRSSSDQGLKIPVDLNRRQSSPLLDTACKKNKELQQQQQEMSSGEVSSGGGVIKASLKIQMPLHIDDTDIPFIEEDNSNETQAYLNQNLNEPASSPIMDDLSSTFPYEEIEARICLGVRPSKDDQGGRSNKIFESKSSRLSGNSNPSTLSSSSSSSHQSPSSSSTSRPPASPNFGSSSGNNNSNSGPPTPITCFPPTDRSNFLQNSPSSSRVIGSSRPALTSPYPHQHVLPTSPTRPEFKTYASEVKGHGKETKGANIGGLIKSKTADFEKLASKSGTGTSYLGGPPSRILRVRKEQGLRDLSRGDSREEVVGHSLSKAKPVLLPESSRGMTTESRNFPSSSSSSSTPPPAIIIETRGRRSNKEPTVIAMSKSSSDLVTTSASPGGPTWKRSEIIASPASKKTETFL